MDDDSPPKRVTRARAAKSDTIKTTKITTAASRAKAAKPKATTPTKRKTRSDEDEEEEHNDHDKMDSAPKKGRGRPKRQMIQEPEPEPEPEEIIEVAPVKPATTRNSRKATATKDVTEEVPAPAPAKVTRGRPKKIVEETPIEPPKTRGRPKKVAIAKEPEEEIIESAPPKKTTRASATTTKKPVAAAKKVTFKDTEPDKENIMPSRTTRGKSEVIEEPKGLKAKPVRKSTAKRATRGRKAAEPEPESEAEKEKPTIAPLSPKKATQISSSKESESDDELATMEKTPMRPLHRSPIKVPGSLFGTAKKLDFTSSVTVNKADIPKGPDFGASILASPARRPPPSPYKDALKASPHRLNLSESKLESPFKTAPKPTPSFKESLLQSPARRPPSPTKVNQLGSPSRGGPNSFSSSMTPQVRRFDISKFGTPKTTTKDLFRSTETAPASVARPNTTAPKRFQSRPFPTFSLNAPQLSFSGRLSSVMPRETDPVASPRRPDEEKPAEAAEPALEIKSECVGSIPEETTEDEDVELEEAANEINDPDPLLSSTRSTTPPISPPKSVRPPQFFDLRIPAEDPFQDSDSEDELASASPKFSPAPLRHYNISTNDFAIPASPRFTALSATPRAKKQMTPAAEPKSVVSRRESARLRRSAMGMTPLAHQLGEWMAASPETSENDESPEKVEVVSAEQVVQSPMTALAFQRQLHGSPAVSDASPFRTTFFEDEMVILDDVAAEIEGDEEDELSPVEPDEEDFAFAAEADEMSLIAANHEDEIMQDVENSHDIFGADLEEPAEADYQAIVDAINQAGKTSPDASQLSEASQEYGDENATPEDPVVVIEEPAPAPAEVTPARPMSNRVFHTVSKVPLKPAAEHTPKNASPMKRSATVSRLPSKRLSSNGSSRSFTPVKRTPQQPRFSSLMPPPSPNVIPSNVATPSRTPRPDLNPETLRGAVVFVDVHTTEGADASGIFVELLVHMGARCVKAWNWGGEEKVGITHVVFKDGGKKTMERVRESNGVVLCVGVGWVLDCERENKWLDESLYAVDTSLIPRGGARRRKSMEPKALANLNGTLVPHISTPRARIPTISPTKEFLNLDTPQSGTMDRRASTTWVRSPASSPDELELSPLPPTPKTVDVRRYVENLGVDDSDDDDESEAPDTPGFLDGKAVQMTAPVQKFRDEDEDELASKKEVDKGLMHRLLAARRKSLQFAPKVGSRLNPDFAAGL